MNLYIVLFDVDKNIALFKNNDDYNLPCCKTMDDKNNELTLCEYLKKEFGLNAKEEDFKLEINDDNNLYYLCYEPYFLNEFKRNLDKITWIKEDVLKDVLTNLNTKNSNKLIQVLTKILRSNFSFSKSERKFLIDKMKEAKESNDTLLYNYYSEIAKSKILNKDNLDEINKRYGEQFKIRKTQEEKRIKEIERQNYINKLKETDLIDLTEEEAKLIGRYDEWDEIMTDFFKGHYLIPVNPKGNNMFLFDAEMKLQGKTDITPNVLFQLVIKYHDCTYEEAKEDLENLLKEKNKH